MGDRVRRGARGAENNPDSYKLAYLVYYMYSCACVIYRVHISLKFVNMLICLNGKEVFIRVVKGVK